MAERIPWPDGIPLVVVYSTADEVVPPEGTKRLITALKSNSEYLRSSPANFYIVELSESPHCNMPCFCAKDRQAYKSVLDHVYDSIVSLH